MLFPPLALHDYYQKHELSPLETNNVSLATATSALFHSLGSIIISCSDVPILSHQGSPKLNGCQLKAKIPKLPHETHTFTQSVTNLSPRLPLHSFCKE